VGFKDWTYDVFASRGNTGQLVSYNGFADYAAYQALINLPNYGAGAVFNNGRTGLLANCTSGLNPFVTTPVSQDCLNILQSQLKTSTSLDQEQVEASIQGAAFNVPAGELRFALGANYRSNDFDFRPDRGISTQNITSLTIGLFDTTATQGSVEVKEGFVEVLAPVLKDIPFVQALNINAGYRYSDYDTVGGVSTWKMTLDWDINDFVRIRGGQQQANRAPNVAELFQPAVFSTVPWPDHDPCSILTRAPYGNVASNPNRAQVQALCTALAGGFAIGNNYIGNVPSYFNLGRDLTVGNPNLDSEEAETFTIGAVLRSPFEAAALRSLTFSVDYYSITIDDAIAPATTQSTYQQCFNGAGTNPTYDPNNQYCRLILRQPTNGFWIATNAQFQNLGVIETSGIDAQLDWSSEASIFGRAAGNVFANINFNYLESYEVQNFIGGPKVDYAGTVGAAIAAPPYGSQFRWKSYTTLGYSTGPAQVTLGWRHLPKTKNWAIVTNPTVPYEPTDSYDQVDLAARWSFSSALTVRLGIDNVFDAEPNIVGAITGTSTQSGVTDPSVSYDPLGRRYYLGLNARF
jgi:outer membrane receptor protein involved in Fe transport